MKKQGVEKLGFLLHDVARLMRRRLEERGSEYGLSAAQWRLLFNVFKEEGATQARLAEILEIEPISVSRLIDRMAEGGWVERREAKEDRRVRMVFPTPKAHAAWGGIRKIGGQVYEDALIGLSDDERLALIGTLEKMTENLGGDVAAAASWAEKAGKKDETR